MNDMANHDVVIIGAGLAGLAAANKAAECGARVLVLEQGADEHYLCNTRITGGFFHVARDNMRDPPAEIRRRIDAATRGYSDPGLADALANDSTRALEWLAAQGVRFIKAGPAGQIKNSLAPPSVRKPGLNNWRGRAGDVMLRTLVARLGEQGGSMLRGVRATELVMKGGRCVGVVAFQDGVEKRFHCNAVIIADGGFQADPAQIRQHISPAPERVMPRNAGSGLGDGTRMARAAGAKLLGLNRFYGHLLYRDAMQSDRFWPYPTIDFLASGAIVVEGKAQRFVDEGLGGTHISNEIAALPDPLSTYVIFDAAIWNGPGRDNEFPPNPHVIEAGGKLLQAASLRELAAMIDVPADALQQTVDIYNAAIAKGTLNKLLPPRSAHAFKPWPIATAPFHAMPVCAGLTYTMGGIATDADGRALREDGSPISGLFAAGSCTGGLEGGAVSGYTGGLSKAAVFGMRAGECAGRFVRNGMPAAANP
jgi:fumarate reductase flavoprotein subunit